MAGSPFDLYDRLLDGKLRSVLLNLRARHMSIAEISHLLYRDHEINVTSETVRRWYARLDLEEVGGGD